MPIDQYSSGQEVDVIVCTKRGKQAEWIPATIISLTEDSVTVEFESGARQKFHVPFETRVKARGEISDVIFKV